MSPNDVNLDNSKQVRERLYGKNRPGPQCKLKINDVVRIPLEKNIFSKVGFQIDALSSDWFIFQKATILLAERTN